MSAFVVYTNENENFLTDSYYDSIEEMEGDIKYTYPNISNEEIEDILEDIIEWFEFDDNIFYRFNDYDATPEVIMIDEQSKTFVNISDNTEIVSAIERSFSV